MTKIDVNWRHKMTYDVSWRTSIDDKWRHLKSIYVNLHQLTFPLLYKGFRFFEKYKKSHSTTFDVVYIKLNGDYRQFFVENRRDILKIFKIVEIVKNCQFSMSLTKFVKKQHDLRVRSRIMSFDLLTSFDVSVWRTTSVESRR